MTGPSRAEAGRFAVLHTALHGALWLFWAAGMVAARRYLEHTFHDVAFKVPASTELLLAAERWLEWLWLPLLAVLGFWLALDGGVSYLLRRRPEGRRAARVWSGIMLALPALAVVYSFLSLWLPLIQLRRALTP
jgi:hypothetical protein